MDVSHRIDQIIQSGGNSQDWMTLVEQLKCANCSQDLLRHVYTTAINNAVDKQSKSYKKLLIGFAELQREISPEAARQVYKSACSLDRDCAVTCIFYAQFESQLGNLKEATDILLTAVSSGRVPKHMLQKAYRKLLEGKDSLFLANVNPWDDAHQENTCTSSIAEASPVSAGFRNEASSSALKAKSWSNLGAPVRGVVKRSASGSQLKEISKKSPSDELREKLGEIVGHSFADKYTRREGSSDDSATYDQKSLGARLSLTAAIEDKENSSSYCSGPSLDVFDTFSPYKVKKQSPLSELNNTTDYTPFGQAFWGKRLPSRGDISQSSFSVADDSKCVTGSSKDSIQEPVASPPKELTPTFDNDHLCTNGTSSFEVSRDVRPLSTIYEVDTNEKLSSALTRDVSMRNSTNGHVSSLSSEVKPVPAVGKAERRLECSVPVERSISVLLPTASPVTANSSSINGTGLPLASSAMLGPVVLPPVSTYASIKSVSQSLVSVQAGASTAYSEIVEEKVQNLSVTDSRISSDARATSVPSKLIPPTSNIGMPGDLFKTFGVSSFSSSRSGNKHEYAEGACTSQARSVGRGADTGKLGCASAFPSDAAVPAPSGYGVRAPSLCLVSSSDARLDSIGVCTPATRGCLDSSKNDGGHVEKKGALTESCSRPPQLSSVSVEPKCLVSSGPRTELSSALKCRDAVAVVNQETKCVVIKGKTYLLKKMIGRGGSCKVYEVCDADGRSFALKKVKLVGIGGGLQQCYLNEIQLLEKLKGSPCIIRLYEWELQDGNLIMILEKGTADLATVLRDQVLDVGLIRNYWRQVLTAVQAIHDVGIVHADLKPANFLLVGDTIKLIDFGIANILQADKSHYTRDGMLGTMNYMAPETINDGYRVSTSSDVYSLGCILYAMVYKKTPFQDITSQSSKLAAILTGRIAYPPISDADLMDCLKGCLRYDKRDRYTTDQLLRHPFLAKPGSAG